MEDKTTTILRSQHNLIINLLKEASRMGIRTQEGSKAFRQARKVLKKHIELENLRFYPVLFNQKKYRALAEQCSEDMLDLMTYLEEIFKVHENGYYPLEFREDMEKVVDLLKRQFSREELDLFASYDGDSRAQAA